MSASELFQEPDVRTVARALDRDFGSRLTGLEEAVESAGTGSSQAARRYLDEWMALTNSLLALARRVGPPPAGFTLAFFQTLAPGAPISPWVTRFGLRTGLGLYLVNEVRIALARDPLHLPSSRGGHLPARASRERYRTTAFFLLAEFGTRAGQAEAEPSLIEQVMAQFGLDRTEFAKLFGVSRQAVDQWLTRGVPAERQAKLVTIAAIGSLLSHKLKAGLLPGVARRPAAAYRDRTMLQVIEDDEQDRLLDRVRESFDWAATA